MSTELPLGTNPVLQNWSATAGHFVFEQDTMWSLDLGAVDHESHWVDLLVTTAMHELAAHTVAPLLRVDDSVAGDHPRLRINIDATNDIPGSDSPEAFTLDIRPESLTVRARSAQGARWALNALTQLTQSHEVACGTAHEWPSSPVRGFVIDVGRRFATPGFLHGLIKKMSHSNVNTLVVHLNNPVAVTGTTTVPVGDEAAGDWSQTLRVLGVGGAPSGCVDLTAAGGRYTRTNWEELDDTAAQYGVTLVPKLDDPAQSSSGGASNPAAELVIVPGDPEPLDSTGSSAPDLELPDDDENILTRLLTPAFPLLAQQMWTGSVPGVTPEQSATQASQLPPFLAAFYG